MEMKGKKRERSDSSINNLNNNEDSFNNNNNNNPSQSNKFSSIFKSSNDHFISNNIINIKNDSPFFKLNEEEKFFDKKNRKINDLELNDINDNDNNNEINKEENFEKEENNIRKFTLGNVNSFININSFINDNKISWKKDIDVYSRNIKGFEYLIESKKLKFKNKNFL